MVRSSDTRTLLERRRMGLTRSQISYGGPIGSAATATNQPALTPKI